MAKSFYRNNDPGELPLYTAVDAALFLQMAPATLRNWVREGLIWTPSRQKDGDWRLSFNALVEGYMMRSLRRNERIPLQSLRIAQEYMRTTLDERRPLLTVDVETDRQSLFIRKLGKLINASRAGQVEMQAMMTDGLRRIEYDEAGLLRALSPWLNDLDEPQHVALNPRIAFGRLTIAGTGIRADVVADRFQVGETIREIAKDYDIEPMKVESAVRWARAAEEKKRAA